LTIPDRQVGNRHGSNRRDVEDGAGGITINSEQVSTGTVDCHGLVHHQYPGTECDDAGDTRGVDDIAIICLRERLTQ